MHLQAGCILRQAAFQQHVQPLRQVQPLQHVEPLKQVQLLQQVRIRPMLDRADSPMERAHMHIMERYYY